VFDESAGSRILRKGLVIRTERLLTLMAVAVLISLLRIDTPPVRIALVVLVYAGGEILLLRQAGPFAAARI
jgi:hypothetical protein